MNDLPALKIPFTNTQKALEVLALTFLLGGIAIVAWLWPSIPDRVPTHFNLFGQADACPCTLR